MAVVDIFSNADLQAGKLANPAYCQGAQPYHVAATASIGATDSATSVYRIIKGLRPQMIITSIALYNDALGSGAVISIGVYKPKTGAMLTTAAVNASLFGTGIAVATAPGNGVSTNGVNNITPANRFKTIADLLGLSTKNLPEAYDLAITLTTAGGSAGVVAASITMVQG